MLKSITHSWERDALSYVLLQHNTTREQEMTKCLKCKNFRKTNEKNHTKVNTKDVDIAEHQKKDTYGLKYELTLQRIGNSNVLTHPPVVDWPEVAYRAGAGLVVLEAIVCNVPLYEPILFQQKFNTRAQCV